MTPTILTASGKYFNFAEPTLNDYNIGDIAHGLAQVCRFAGQTLTFYSVAQHSVLASHLVPAEDMLAALLHDAQEAFLGDVPAPLKMLLPDYRAIEKNIERHLRASFGLPDVLPPSVKQADLIMLATEKRDLMAEHDDDEFERLKGIGPAPFVIQPWSCGKACAEFLHRFHKLTGNPLVQ